jgi:GNAT superfamily N-acetyltransferase
VIRPGVPADRPTLTTLHRTSSLANAGDRKQLLAHPEAIGVPLRYLEENRVLVALMDGRRVGFATVLPRPDGDAELDALFVDPSAWRRGIGRALLDRCVALARRDGARFLHVVGNPHARRFYDACGFLILGSTAMALGPGLLMRKSIS